MATMVMSKCAYCGNYIKVREADVKRGWGRFCDKSCKASHQSFGPKLPPPPKPKPKATKKPTPKNMQKGGVQPPPRVSMKDTPKPENYGEFS